MRLLRTFLAVLAINSIAFAEPATNKTSGMALIRGGAFRPLFRSITDAKEIIVEPYWLDVCPVTNEEFLEFVKANSQWRRSQVKRLFADDAYLRAWAGDLELGTNARPRAPVTFVSWPAAKAYAQFKGKRLPSSAEWELAASASATRPDGESDPHFRAALMKWNSTPSGSLGNVGGEANYWGVCDLHGLIWEWVGDFNSAMITGDSREDSGLERQMFCGSASAGARDPANYSAFMRYGFRSSLQADYCIHNLGFRCARNFERE